VLELEKAVFLFCFCEALAS